MPVTAEAEDAAGPWALVLDVGSSSVRAGLYDGSGRGMAPPAEAQQAYGWRSVPEGAMECDARALAERTESVLDAVVAQARGAGVEIVAVAATGFWHGLLGLDAAGEPATPVYGWGDTRAAPAALRLLGEVDEAALHERTGCFLHPSYPLVKLAWLRESEPELFGHVARWGSFAEYLEVRWFGEPRSSLSMASGTGLLDVHRLAWDDEAVEIAGVRAEQLPPLVDAGDAARGLRPDFARRWPELAEVPWFPALGDGACANVGSGAVGAERQAVTVGTSAAMRVLWAPEGELRVPERLWCYRLDARRCVAGGALSNGGNAVAFLRRFLRLPAEDEWEREIAAMPPDGHGLTVLPYLVGERGPGWLLEREAVVVGLTQATSPTQLLRAWMEAIAYRLAEVAERVGEAVGRPAEIRASGGALHGSPVWAQMLADVTGVPVALTAEREATARGAALVALESLGAVPALEAAPFEAAAHFAPDAGRRARYLDGKQRQEELARALDRWAGAHGGNP